MPPGSSISSDKAISTLLAWCETRGIQIDGRIQLIRNEDESISVYTRDAFVSTGETLVTIPKTALLSIRSRDCALIEHLPSPVIYGAEAQLGLALCLYGEILRGAKSRWAGYIQSLPLSTKLPLFWDPHVDDEGQALRWETGTMLMRDLQSASFFPESDGKFARSKNSYDDVKFFFMTVVRPAVATVGLGQANLHDFQIAYGLVSSRAFMVDTFHGLSMVPIADAFNHHNENTIHLENDYDVCPTCGSYLECPHDEEDIVGISDSPTNVSLEGGSGRDTHGGTCEMVMNASVPPFTEVFNTYGDRLTNAQLLGRYGFLLDGNEHDVLQWSAHELCGLLPLLVRGALGETTKGSTCLDGQRDATSKELFHDDDSIDCKHEKISEGAHPDLSMETQTKENIQSRAIGQYFLGQLADIHNASLECEAAFSESTLVYHTNCGIARQATKESTDGHTQSRYRADIGASSFEASNISHQELGQMGCKEICCVVDRKSPRDLYQFDMDDTGRISCHLLIFCILMASHFDDTKYFPPKVTSEDTTRVKSVMDLLERCEVGLELESAHGSSEEAEHNGDDGELILTELKRVSPCAIETFISEEATPKRSSKSAKETLTQGAPEDSNVSMACSTRTLSFHHEQGSSGGERKRARSASAASSELVHPRSPCITVFGSEKMGKRSKVQKAKAHILSNLLSGYASEDLDNNSLDSDTSSASLTTPNTAAQISVAILEDNRAHPGRESEKESKRRRVAELRDPSFSVPFGGTGESIQTEPASGAVASATLLNLSFGGSTSIPRLELTVFAVSTLQLAARVLIDLCRVRWRQMAYPELSVKDLGEVVDAIPQSRTYSRMAAQLALAERVRLEGCISAWTDLSRVAAVSMGGRRPHQSSLEDQ